MSAPLYPNAPLTAGQQGILDAIVELHAASGKVPTRIEIGRHLETTAFGYIGRVIDKLRAKGLLPVDAKDRHEYRLDANGPIRALFVGEGYALVRWDGGRPYVISEDDWQLAPRCDKEGKRL